MAICNALLKYGYSKFSVEILEYCDSMDLIKREQYYIDLLKPEYNILKIAGSRLGSIHSEETRAKIALSLMGEKNPMFGKARPEKSGSPSVSIMVTDLDTNSSTNYD